MLSHRDVLLNRSLFHWVTQENHLEYHIVSTLCTEENDTPITWAPSPLTGVHIISSQMKHLSHRVGAIQMSHGYKSLAPWWVSWLAVCEGNQWCDWCFLFYTWCWGGIVASMWTTFDGGHFVVLPMSAWTTMAYDQCGWLSPSQECNVSTGSNLS